ncbi:MAG: D-glycerate dehydrogenase [Myxococcota bacterium]|nr:D-glycerate dehydrogenase [Myxococcota bacterium]
MTAPRPRAYATRALPGGALAAVASVAALEVWPGPGPLPAEILEPAARDAEGLLCLLTDRIDAGLLGGCPRLRVVSSMSVGVDHIDLVAATERRIPVGHTPGVLTETTADLAFGLLLDAARRIAEGDRYVRAGDWRPERVWEPDMLLGRDVHGATLGILGLGAIGRAVARRAAGFGMRVLGWSRTRRELPGVAWRPLEDLLAEADFVSVHVALAPETRGLLDAAALARMKPGAVLVNTARGGIVDEAALAAALRSGRLAAAGLDVFEREPLAASSPLRALPQVVLTPHLGSASRATRARMAELAVANLLAGLRGERLPHCANPEVYE